MATTKDETTSEHDLLLCSYAQHRGENYLGPLRQRGFQVHVTASLAEIRPLLNRLKLPILIVDCGTGPDQALEIIRLLVNTPDFFRYPLILLGHDVDASERLLNERYLLAATLCHPVTAVDLVEAIFYVAKSTKAARNRVEPPVRPDTQPTAVTIGGQGLFDGKQSVPEVLINILREKHLLERSFGGREYPKLHHEKVVQLSRLGRLESHFQARSELLGPWSVSHLARTAYVTEKLGEALGYAKPRVELAWQAAYLLGVGLQSGQRDVLRVDYSRSKAEGPRKDLCSRIKDSAMTVGVEMQLPELSAFMALVARQIGREEMATDEENSSLASLLIACELADRITFQSGFWSPRAAYYLLRKFKSGNCNDVHPLMLAVVMKYISEAMAASPPGFLITKSIRENPALLAQAAEQAGEGEAKIPVENLEPGMKLSRPLRAFDGRQILQEDLVLDEDLIFRIWQLAAIRPLNQAIVFSNSRPQ